MNGSAAGGLWRILSYHPEFDWPETLRAISFSAACSNDDKAEILQKLKDVLLSLNLGGKNFYMSIDKAQPLEKDFLVERHLISRHHAFGKGPRGAVIAEDEFFTAMINEEDHLRTPGTSRRPSA